MIAFFYQGRKIKFKLKFNLPAKWIKIISEGADILGAFTFSQDIIFDFHIIKIIHQYLVKKQRLKNIPYQKLFHII